MSENVMTQTQKKYCRDCGRLIGSYPGMDYHVFFRVTYCPDCAQNRRRESNRLAQRKFRGKRSEMNRVLRDAAKREKERADTLKDALEEARRLLKHYRNMCADVGLPVE